MEKKQNVPVLRFPGFSGEWKKKRLEEMGASFSYGLNAAATTYDGQHKYLRITDIDDESRKFSGKELTSPNVDLSNASDYLDYKLQENDIVFARTGASVGKTYLYDTSDGDVYYAGFLIRVKIDSKYDANFIFQKTLTSDYSHFVVVTSQRSGQPGINAQEYANWEMLVPELNEQKKIGRFLTDFDKNIFVCREKIQKLQQFRQAMLTKLFPREGAAEPELRFRGFSGKWKLRTLAKCAALHARIGWQNLRKSEFLTKGDYYLITGTDFVDGQIEWRTCHYVSKLRYDQDKNIQVQNGDILVTKDGTLGKVAYVDGADKPATLNAGVFNVKINVNDVDAKYLYQYLKGPYLMDYVNQRATGGTIKHLNQNILVDFPVVMPSFEEQKIIGDFFYRLDRYISLQQKKLERMQRLKAALLEKLFV